MAFWGIEVKPGKPYTHTSEDGRRRLRISQATLANGSATQKSLVQCNVGDKLPVLICALLPDKSESLQLDLEFEEVEHVMFSVIGPRGVYLTGYYVGHNGQNMQDDTESYGEDIGNSETPELNHYSDEDEYDDSFINDDEPEPLTPSPVSSSRDDDSGEYLKKKRNGNGGRKRLKKKYQLIVSDDEMSVQEIDDKDNFPISSICKNMSEASGRKSNKEKTVELDKETKYNGDKYKLDALDSPVPDAKEKVDEHLVDGKTKGGSDVPHESLLLCAQIPLNEVKTKKKRKEHSKKENAITADDENHIDTLENKRQQSKVESDSMNHDVSAAKGDTKPNDTAIDYSLEVLPSAEVGPEKNSKPKKKRKGRNEVNTDATTDNKMLTGNKQEHDQPAIDNSSQRLADGNQSDEKKVKKKRKKTSKAQEVEENMKMEVEKENKPSAAEHEGKSEDCGSCNRRTLSNGLVIEDLVTGNSKGKVAASGRKVKVEYVVKLKDNGQVIDSNGKAPHRFRLGDKEVIEGLNVGLDGMRVGDKRRLTIPPSMSVGYQGTGENIPPNSWLVYDVEMVSIH